MPLWETLGIAAGLAMFGILLPHDWWRALAIASSVVSLVLCALFWNTYLIVGPVVAVGTPGTTILHSSV